MSNSIKIKILKIAVLAVVFMFVGGLVATAESNNYGTGVLKIGSKGEAVQSVQILVGVTADGEYGPMTAAAVRAWQASNNLGADGVFGPASRARALTFGGVQTNTTIQALCPNGMTVISNCTTAAVSAPVISQQINCANGAMYNTTTGAPCNENSSTNSATLSGDTGEISEINQISQYSGEEVESGAENVKILGLDIDATNDGDVAIKSIKLIFDNTGYASSDSTKLADYLENVYVYLGSTEVGSSGVSDFTKNETAIYSKTITLNNAVIRAGETEKFYISVDAVSDLDSGDIDSDSWTVAIDNIRYLDGGGAVTVIDSSDSLLSGNIDYDSAGQGVSINFVSDNNNNNDDTPEMETGDADNISDDSARIAGSVDMNDFDDGRVFFVYGEDENQIEDVADDYDTYSSVDEDGNNLQKVSVDSSLSENSSYTSTISDLDNDTDYYYNICVQYENDDGEDQITCGDVENFTTDN